MFDKAAMFFLMGTLGAMLVICYITIAGAILFGIYSAYMASPLWTGIGVLFWLVCALVTQRLFQGEVKK